MKSNKTLKKNIKIVVVFVLFSLLFSSCGNKKEVFNDIADDFSEIILTETDNVNVENVKSVFFAENEIAAYYFDIGFYSRDELSDIVGLIDAELISIQEKTKKATSKVNVFLLGDNTKMITHYNKNYVYVVKKDVGDAKLKSALTGAAFGVNEPWVAYGISAWVFDIPINQSALWNYYSNVSALSALRLFGAHFYPVFYLENEIRLSQDTAASLACFIIENYDWETLLKGGNSKIKQEWLYSLDINKEYKNELETVLSDFNFYSSNNYPMIIETKTNTYFIGASTRFNVNDQIENFIHRDIKSKEFIVYFLNNNAKQNIDLFNLDIINEVNIYWDYDVSADSWETYYDNNNVYIKGNHQLYLNMVIKALLDAESYSDEYDWLSDALATYIVISDKGSYNYEDMGELLHSSYGTGKRISEYYNSKKPDYKTNDEYDAVLIFDAIARVSYLYADIYESAASWAEPTDVNAVNNPNELSFVQRQSFVGYLIKEYSFDTLLDMYKNNIDFEKTFSKSYEALKEDWLSFIEIEIEK